MFVRIRSARLRSIGLTLASLVVLAPHVGSATGASYTYDQLGRLTTALYSNGTCIAYAYDANGNRTSQSITASGAPESPNWGSGVWGCFLWTHQ